MTIRVKEPTVPLMQQKYRHQVPVPNYNNFDHVRITLASPQHIRDWSYGEVKKAETINYRTFKPERDGLFCERIFGPVRDWECNCGKYKYIRHKGIICDRCGVEVTESRVRRERMGHIELAVPVAHIWFWKKLPSKLGLLLDIGQRNVEKVVYYQQRVLLNNLVDSKGKFCEAVVNSGDSTGQSAIRIPCLKYQQISNDQYSILQKTSIHELLVEYNWERSRSNKDELDPEATVGTGAGAIHELLARMDLELERDIYMTAAEIKSASDDYLWYKFFVLLLKKYIRDSIGPAEFNKDKNELIQLISSEKLAVELQKVVKEIVIPSRFDRRSKKKESKQREELQESLSKKIIEIKNAEFTKYVELIMWFAQGWWTREWNARNESHNRQRAMPPLSDNSLVEVMRIVRLINSFISSKDANNPRYMIMTVLPVLPPGLRPLVPLEGGRFASSDLNDLYRRIINRNNRLRHMIGLKAPEVMIHNEKRLLQEAVDALIENGTRGRVVTGAGGRPLKSFSDVLKGKQGRFRQNLLGKRVDYSGRAVVVVGPNLKLHQCGLPKEMALELFKPFILRELIQLHKVTLKAAKRMLEHTTPEVWDILEAITRQYPILLNRAPTLHRLSIQAFEPVLVEGKAIQLHPLTCAAFNADFDGDQMAVHVPLSLETQLESRFLLWAPYNIMSPASGRPLATHTQDIVLGLHYLTKEKLNVEGEGKVFSDEEDVLTAYHSGILDFHARIKVAHVPLASGRILGFIQEPEMKPEQWSKKENIKNWKNFTTVGRVIFNNYLPKEMRYINRTINKRDLADLVKLCYKELGLYRTAEVLDDLKKLGFKYATGSGLSISVTDMNIPEIKEKLLVIAEHDVKSVTEQARKGAITDLERYNKIVDIWTHVTERVTDGVFKAMEVNDNKPHVIGTPKFNSILMMARSGARGGSEQTRQLCGMRGLMTRPARKLTGQMGEIIESPVKSNFREGLTVLEYFISAHGGRKGLADTALKTAEAGYLTRKLVDVSHDIVITEPDCGTINGIRITTLRSGDDIIETLEERINGRVALDNVADPIEDTTIIKAGDIISPDQAKKVAEAGIESIRIRSVLNCEAKHGVCAKCYGINLTTNKLIEVGEAVGIIAAQSIGEPGTQLTLRTFHVGGTAARVVQRTSAKSVRPGAVRFNNCNNDLLVKTDEGFIVNLNRNMVISVIDASKESKRDHHQIPYGAKINVNDGQVVEAGVVLAEFDPHALPIISEYEGWITLEDVEEGKTLQVEFNKVTGSTERRIVQHRIEDLNPRVEVLIPERFQHISKLLVKIEQSVTKEKTVKRVNELIDLTQKFAQKIDKDEITDKAIQDYRVLVDLLKELEDEKEIAAEQKAELKKAFPPTYVLPVDTYLLCKNLTKAKVGEMLAKTPLEVSKTKDITGGLPRVVELFEARKPKSPAIISELDGNVHISPTSKGLLEVTITNEDTGMKREYDITQGKHLVVREGDKIAVGEPLTDGAVNSHDILRILQAKGLQEHLVNEIQEVYRLQGVSINDKHIEIVVRQMLSFVRITRSGDTGLLVGETVKRSKLEEENMNARKNNPNAKPADAQPILLGITRASLYSDSFISAASFQETTRILTEAAVNGEYDNLVGLKENVVIGKLIPAGTGLSDFSVVNKKEK